VWFYVQMWLPVWTVALTAAICFSVASFIMGRSVTGLLYWPPQLAASSVPSTDPPEEKNERGRNSAE
jgi:hypothetical protein